jgi:hypothetical protein
MEWESEEEDYVALPELTPSNRICLTCGNVSGSNTWNRKHYYSYAKENDYNPWICGYTNEPANIKDYDESLEKHFTPPIQFTTMEHRMPDKSKLRDDDYEADDEDVEWYISSPELSQTDSEENIEIIMPANQEEQLNFGAFSCTQEEYNQIFNDNIKVKNVIANQPIRKGGSKCTSTCDMGNHHTHFYCKMCKTNLPYGRISHDCVIGFEPGKIRPEMISEFLINELWWKEPCLVQIEKYVSPRYFNYLRHLYYNITLPFPIENTQDFIPELD